MAVAEIDLRYQDLIGCGYRRALFCGLAEAIGVGTVLSGFRSHTARMAEKAFEITGS
jgi:hypothetical protein